MSKDQRGQFAIVSGASSGIGRQLAGCCAEDGFDLLIAADEPSIETAAEELRALGGSVEALCVDLGTQGGVDALVAAVRGRPVDALLANAGRGLGEGFLDQDWGEISAVIGTKVGTEKKDDPADVAKDGYKAMLAGDGEVVSGWKNKVQAIVANLTPAAVLAAQHRKIAEPGSAKKR